MSERDGLRTGGFRTARQYSGRSPSHQASLIAPVAPDLVIYIKVGSEEQSCANYNQQSIRHLGQRADADNHARDDSKHDAGPKFISIAHVICPRPKHSNGRAHSLEKHPVQRKTYHDKQGQVGRAHSCNVNQCRLLGNPAWPRTTDFGR